MAERIGWVATLAAPSATVLGAYGAGVRGRRLFSTAAVAAVALAVASSLPLALELWKGTDVFGLPPLATVLVPFAAFLWLMTVVVTPSGRRNDAGLARSAAACLLHMGAFLTVSPWALLAIWIATSLLFTTGNRDEPFARARRVSIAHLGLSTLLLALGIILTTVPPGGGSALAQWGVAAILVAVMIRKGIFPFHAWIPEIFDQGRIGPAARFNAPQIGTYVALVLAVPRASPALLHLFALLATATAVWCSLLALHQADARRACGYLFVSQSALVLAGLDLPGREALAGALILWVSSGVALAGLARAVLALEARRGRLRLDARHGGYERMPQLAVCFLIMCLAIANFPGTLGFVGGEMLVRGAVGSFPLLGVLAVAAGAMNGLAAMRMYFSLFCGKRDSGAHLSLKRAEAFGFAAAAFVLLGFGLVPGGLSRVLANAGSVVVQARVSP